MWTSKVSQEKVSSLRLFTGSSLPDSRLRGSLIRHGGDINAAASELLLLQNEQKEQQKPSNQSPPARRDPAPPQPVGKSDTASARPDGELRRKAWRMFFMDNHAFAQSTVGSNPKDINEYITSKWKQIGSVKRQEYTKRAAADNRENGLPESSHSTNNPETCAERSPAPSCPPDHHQRPEPHKRCAPQAAAPPVLRRERTTDASESRARNQDIAESVKRDSGDARSVETSTAEDWPKKLAVRVCTGSMLARGKNLLRAGDELVVQAPAAQKGGNKGNRNFRGKGREPAFSEPTRIARFYKDNRELGRLSPDISSALAPALQTKYVSATCKVISAPELCRWFSEVFLEVSIFVSKDAFQNPADSKQVEAGIGKGIDTERINVVHMISALGICEPVVDGGDLEKPLPNPQGDPGSVAETEADAYCRTVDAIDLKQASDFSTSKFLSCSLREYQKAGVAWMLAREKYGSRAHQSNPGSVDFVLNPLWKKRIFPDRTTFFINPTTGQISIQPPMSFEGGPYGGILADEMGLGKTVQCIACIVHDHELSSDTNASSQVRKKSHTSVEEDRKPHKPARKARAKKPEGHHSSDTDESDFEPTSANKQETRLGRRSRMLEENEADVDATPLKRPRRSVSTRSMTTPQASRTGATAENDSDGNESPIYVGSSESDTDTDTEGTGSKQEPDAQRSPRQKKTSALSLLLESSKKIPTRGGTLVVCPLSLVTQWVDEFSHHVAPKFLRVTAHYGTNRGSVHSISLKSADVVVTTYGVLSSQVAKDNGEDEDEAEKSGPIFQLHWRRVILDEAHVIKTRTTQWAKACYNIRADKRWCVTGTVIHNHVNDAFSLLHFIGLHPWSSWAFWNKGIVANLESKDAGSQKAAMAMVRDIISSVTLRRRKSTKDSDGHPIIQLTEKKVDIVTIDPSPEEKDFYTSLHEQSKLQFDTFVAQGKVLSNYATVLELLLRLRQACDHPYLVIAAAPSKDSALLKNRSGLIKRFLDAGSSQQFVETVFKEAESGSLEKTRECPLCLDIIDDPVAPKECGHPACRACLTTAVRRSQKCPVCRAEVQLSSIYTLPRQTRFAVDLKKRWRSSAKIDMLLGELRERRDTRKKGEKIGKTVIFSQFTSMLDLVGMALDKESFRSLRIDGSVAQKQRASILEQFENEDELEVGSANILLVSLRAGGVGLNLVSASHAILLDIHWNPQVDAQAQDRIHRHGQTRDVLIRRYIVKDSVEEKLLQVQARKQDMADGALGAPTDEDKKQARLSELKLLFSASA